MDVATGKYWYGLDSGYWVPFTTTVPGVDIFSSTQVTMYFKKNNAPEVFLTKTNIPEARHKYTCLEFTFEKRMSNGWQLGGSINWAKLWGNHSADVYSPAQEFNSPNSWLVNKEGRLLDDRPLVIKLYGTFNIPLGFVASFYYNYYDGTPWARRVSVVPPSAWAAANDVNPYATYTVNLEEPGTRRNYTFQNCDFRLEKIFKFGKIGALGAYIDIFNLLGQSYVNVNQNPGGTWYPKDNNTTAGTYRKSGSYKTITGINNVARVFRFSVRYSF